MSDDQFDDQAHRCDGELDRALTEAGARWRAGQPPAGSVDDGLFRTGADRRRSRWLAASVAAAVVLIAAGVLTAAQITRDDRTAPASGPTSVAETRTASTAGSTAAGTTGAASSSSEQLIVCTVALGADEASVTVTLPEEADRSAAQIPRTAMSRSAMPMSTMPMSTMPTSQMPMSQMPMSQMPMSTMAGPGMPGPGMMRPSTADGARTPSCAELGYQITATGCLGWTATMPSTCSDPCPGAWETTWGSETISDGQPSADAGGSGSCPAVPSTVAPALTSAAGAEPPHTAPLTDGSILPEPPHTIAETTAAHPTAVPSSVPGG